MTHVGKLIVKVAQKIERLDTNLESFDFFRLDLLHIHSQGII